MRCVSSEHWLDIFSLRRENSANYKYRTELNSPNHEFAGLSVYSPGRLVRGREGHKPGYMDRDGIEFGRNCAVRAEQVIERREAPNEPS